MGAQRVQGRFHLRRGHARKGGRDKHVLLGDAEDVGGKPVAEPRQAV